MVAVVQLPRLPANGELDVLVEQVRAQLNAALAPYQLHLEPYGMSGRWRDSTLPPVRRRAFLFGLRRRNPFAALFFHVRHADPAIQDPASAALYYLRERLDELAQGGLHLVSAMPNWLLIAAPSLYNPGGPALPPRAAPSIELAGVANTLPLGWHLSFVDPAIPSVPQNAAPVTVAILDTAQHPDRVRTAALRPELRRNWLLQSLAASLRDNDGSFEIDYSRRYYLTDDVATGRDSSNNARYFLMPDHGLFVAGIVRDLAPHATIRLMRVLNDYGGGDLYNLFAALTDLEAELVAGSITRLVINLSATIMPPPRRLPYLWFDDYTWPSRQLAEPIRALQHIEEGLRLLFECLYEEGALVVAAAGNDSLYASQKGEPPAPPRAPARYDSVLSVTSVNSRHAPSLFANAANVAPYQTGIAAFGGDHAGAQDEGGLPDAVRGLYITTTFPEGEQNTSGWADWCGTSFSTAMISALSARLMAQGRAASDALLDIAAGPVRRERIFGSKPDALSLLANIVQVQQKFGVG
jgi:hypothetical protein